MSRNLTASKFKNCLNLLQNFTEVKNGEFSNLFSKEYNRHDKNKELPDRCNKITTYKSQG